MNSRAVITITFTDWWLSGTGRAGSGDVDAVPHRDRFGCPAMPMSQVKGQLRESAVRLAAARAAGWSESLVDQLFGEPDRTLYDPLKDRRREPGMLAFRGDAALPPAVARRFADDKAVRAQLTRRRSSTRINERGAAYAKALRAVEAAVPFTISGTVEWIGKGDLQPSNWVLLLDAACAATIAFGKMKTDGYGRATAWCKPFDEEQP